MLPTNLRVNRQPGARNEARGSLLLVMHPLFRMNCGFDPQIGKLRMVLSQGGRLLTGSYLLGGLWGGYCYLPALGTHGVLRDYLPPLRMSSSYPNGMVPVGLECTEKSEL